ncbi:MAG: hypothetical protein JJU02_11590 [Cryomorphaceae bacterium]|nr:hypothetical protein [Cryomorphaceae bacterium]
MSNLELINRDISLDETQALAKQTSENVGWNIPISAKKLITPVLISTTAIVSGENTQPFSTDQIVKTTNTPFSITDYEKAFKIDKEEFLRSHFRIGILQSISKRDIIKDILSYKALNNNWDGFSAVPLEVASAANCFLLMDKIDEQIFCSVSNYYPNPNGTITFEWENEEQELVSVEVGNNNFSYFVAFASVEVKYFNNILFDDREINKLAEFIKAL